MIWFIIYCIIGYFMFKYLSNGDPGEDMVFAIPLAIVWPIPVFIFGLLFLLDILGLKIH
jgi:hypothetical protein